MEWPLACLFCGANERVEIFEIWDGGEFMFETCCEGLHESITEEMNRDPEYRAWLLKECGADELGLGKLRRVVDGLEWDGAFRLDFNPVMKPIERDEARAFVDEHHRHNKAPVSWRYGTAIWNGPVLLGVAMVGRPVARMIPADKVVEVNRVCLRGDIPPELRWNASSMLYGWAAREAERRGFEKIITYTLEDEPGTALKAAGWVREAKTRGGSWNRRGRARANVAPIVPKWRWAKYLKPAVRKPAPALTVAA